MREGNVLTAETNDQKSVKKQRLTVVDTYIKRSAAQIVAARDADVRCHFTTSASLCLCFLNSVWVSSFIKRSISVGRAHSARIVATLDAHVRRAGRTQAHIVVLLLCSALRQHGKPTRNRASGRHPNTMPTIPPEWNMMLTFCLPQQGMVTCSGYCPLEAGSTLPTAPRPTRSETVKRRCLSQ